MCWYIKVSVILACMIKLSSAQEGLFGSFGQSGENGLFGGFGQSGEGGPLSGEGGPLSGEGGPLINLLPFIGFGPFGAFGGYGFSRPNVAGGQSGTEGAAETAAEPSSEGPGSRQPSLTDINMMLIWNQLLGANQGYRSTSGNHFNPVQAPETTSQPAPPEGSVASNNRAGQNVGEPYTYNDADMSWMHFFMQ